MNTEKIKQKLITSKPVVKFTSTAKRIKVNKQDDISLYTAIEYFIKELKKNDLGSESKSVAFSFTLAVFPSIIFLFTLIPYLNIPVLNDQNILAFILSMDLPKGMSDTITETVLDIAHKPRGGLLSVGVIMALFMSTNGMIALMNAFNKCYQSSDQRNFIKKRLIAIGLTLLLAGVLFSSVVILVFGPKILDTLKGYGLIPIQLFDIIESLRILEYGVFSLLFFFAISVIYYFAPSMKKRFNFFSYGTFIATGLCLSISAIFSYYINNFGAYNKVYGSIGTLIGFMVWLNLISLILLIGFEVNASIERARTESIST